MVRAQRFGLWAGGFIAAAMVLRIVLVPGIDGSDGLNYNLHAFRIADGTYYPVRHVTSLRWTLILPMALSMKLFGVNELSSAVPALLYGLVQLLLVLSFARALGGPKAALVSLGVAALLPLSVFNASDLHSDLCMAVFQALAVWLVLPDVAPASRPQGGGRWLLAGVMVGLAHLSKAPGAGILAVLVVLAVRTRCFRGLAKLAFAFGLVLVVEAVVYQVTTADPFYRLTTIIHFAHRSAVMNSRYSPEPYVWLLDYPIAFFVPVKRTFMYLSGAGILATLGAVTALRRSDHPFRAVALWFVIMMAVMGLLPADAGFRYPAQIHFARTLAFVTVPLSVLAGLWLVRSMERWPHATYAVTAGVAGACLVSAAVIQSDAQAQVQGLRHAAAFIAERPGARVLTDPRSERILEYLFAYRRDVRTFPPREAGVPHLSLLVDDPRWAERARSYGYPAPAWVTARLADNRPVYRAPEVRLFRLKDLVVEGSARRSLSPTRVFEFSPSRSEGSAAP